MLLDKVNLTLIIAVVTALVWVYATFASAADVEKLAQKVEQSASKADVQRLSIDAAYGQYYDRLDDRDEARDEENDALVKEYERQMERLKATICAIDKKWERCEDVEASD